MRRKKVVKRILIGAGSLLVVLALAALGGWMYFKSNFEPDGGLRGFLKKHKHFRTTQLSHEYQFFQLAQSALPAVLERVIKQFECSIGYNAALGTDVNAFFARRSAR